jgi:hypothetical protein
MFRRTNQTESQFSVTLKFDRLELREEMALDWI